MYDADHHWCRPGGIARKPSIGDARTPRRTSSKNIRSSAIRSTARAFSPERPLTSSMPSTDHPQRADHRSIHLPLRSRHRLQDSRGRGRGRRPRALRRGVWRTMPCAPAPISCPAPASTAVRSTTDGVTITSPLSHRRACPRRACSRAAGGMRFIGSWASACRRCFLHTAQRELPAEQPGDVEVHFGSDVAPRGFGWVVPVRRGTAALCAHRCDGRGRSPTYFMRMVERVASAGAWSCRRRGRRARRSFHSAASHGPTATAAGGRRCRWTGQADDGRGNLLQPGERVDWRGCAGDALSEDDLVGGSTGGLRAPLACSSRDELDTQLTFRTLAQRMPDEDIEGLFDVGEDRWRHANRSPNGVLQSASAADRRAAEASPRPADLSAIVSVMGSGVI